MSVFAAIDLGSTSFHLLVASVQDGQVTPLQKISHKVRLAQGICSQNLLGEAALDRGLSAISEFADALEEWQPQAVRAVGTQALRQAVNRHEFTEQAEEMLGFPIEVIPGEEEAELIWTAIRSEAQIENKHLLTLDIGGGSTEIAVGNGELNHSASLPLGCVTFSDQFFENGKLSPGSWDQAYKTARQVILDNVDFIGYDWDVAMGSSGTIKAACNYAARNIADTEEVKLACRDSLQHMKQEILACNHVDQLQLDGVSEERMPLVPAGLTILEALFDVLEIDQLELSRSAMREAVIQQLNQ